MRTITLDTETTGLTANDNQIAQLSYIIEDDDKFTSAGNLFFTVDKMDLGAYNTHGFSIEKLYKLSKGKVFADEAYKIYNLINSCDCIIGHNIQFDVDFLRNEFCRLGMVMPQKQFMDTMYSNMDIVKATDIYGRIKRPNLTETRKFYNITDNQIENTLEKVYKANGTKAHDARYDTIATHMIYRKMKKMFSAGQL